MAFLQPHFDFDVFVSYSHGDPRGLGTSPLKDWTRALIRRLEAQILSLDTEFDELKIWMDEQIDPTALLTDELRGKVGSAGILLIVMSKRYLGSSWCKDELDWFAGQIRDRSGDQGRVFVLRAQATDPNAWPDCLRDGRGHAMPGFTFFSAADGTPLGWPDLHDTNSDFVKEMCRLQTALTRRLRELRARSEQRSRAEAARAPSAAVGGPRRIYLHAPPDHALERDDIRRALSSEGIVPLTAQGGAPGAMADWQRDATARIETARRCDALALLRADAGDDFVGDLLDIGVDERERIAIARGAPMPCAILDGSGAELPIDVSHFDIARFDTKDDAWRGRFRQWLDGRRGESTGPAP
jgi:hypothetical protein